MINNPILIILIGLPCSGKNFIAEEIIKHTSNTIHLSSDTIRKELFGFEDQTQNHLVFQEMNNRCFECLDNNQNVVYNATNLSQKRRKHLIDAAKNHYNAKVYCILCMASIGTILERNLTRAERHIPEDKIIQLLRTMDVPLIYEGFDRIGYVNTDNLTSSVSLLEWFSNIGKDYDQQNEHHNSSLLEHLELTGREMYNYTQSNDLYVVGRFHDIGKPYAREWNEQKGRYTYYGHEKISAYLFLLHTALSKNTNEVHIINQNHLEMATLIYHHMDKFIRNLDKTKELLGEKLYLQLELLMKADAYRKDDDSAL